MPILESISFYAFWCNLVHDTFMTWYEILRWSCSMDIIKLLLLALFSNERKKREKSFTCVTLRTMKEKNTQRSLLCLFPETVFLYCRFLSPSACFFPSVIACICLYQFACLHSGDPSWLNTSTKCIARRYIFICDFCVMHAIFVHLY